MPTPTVAEFWDLLARTGLVDDGTVASLRHEHAANPALCGGGEAVHVAHWLYKRGVLTRWQAKRLSIGNLGPFFLGDYRLLDRLDRDGDQLVFTGRHEPSARVVSIVLLNSKRYKRLDIWTEIVRRTTAANATTHPMLGRIWSLEQHHGSRFIVCEEITGVNMADELERAGPLPAAQAGVLVAQLAAAVADLHAQEAVHGGISLDMMRREILPGAPERTGRVRLLQFPLAGDPHRVPLRPWRDDDELRKLGRMAASVAPELVHPEAVCDQRSDVYSIGAVLYTLLSGSPPCWDGDAEKTIRCAAFEGPRPLEPPQVSPEMAALVGYLMARDPAKRYQTAADAAAAVATCIGLTGAAAVTARPPVETIVPQSSATAAAASRETVFAPDLAVSDLPTFALPAKPAASPAAPPTTVESQALRARRRRALGLQLLGAAITVVILGGVIALVVSKVDFETPTPVPILPPRVVQAPSPPIKPTGQPSGDRGSEPARPPDQEGTSPKPEAPPAPTARQVIVEDGTLPWASPTEGPPPRLAYLPPGSQLALLARPADLAADEEGRLFLESLGPVPEAALARLAEFCGCQVADIEVVQAGWQAGEADDVLAGYTVRLVAGRKVTADEGVRSKAWGPTTPREIAGETIHVGKAFSFWVPSADDGRVLVVASEAAIATGVPSQAGAAAAREPFIASIVRQSTEARGRPADALLADLPLEIETLVKMLDETRHLTLFGSPHYLLNRGRVVLAGPLAKLADPLRHLFGETMRGAALSAHFGGNTYLELDAIAERDPPARVFAPQLAAQVEGLAGAVEAYCAMLDPSPYGRVLVMRLPSMLRVLVANMRTGVEGNGVVINAYLPRHAGHNLALASELALAQTPGAVVTVAGTPSPPAGGAPADALGKLQKKITVVFARDTLEMAIQMVSTEVGVPMEILGTDLQLDGITQNQSFGLEARDQTADEVLRVILGKANPDGKLVYIVRKTGEAEKILITTRAAVEKRRDPLPPAFQAGATPEMKKP
jgi:serine/threonine-protein kinase